MPRLAIEYAWSAERKQMTVTVRQEQLIDANEPPFAFPIDIWFHEAGSPIRAASASERLVSDLGEPRTDPSQQTPPPGWQVRTIQVSSATTEQLFDFPAEPAEAAV